MPPTPATATEKTPAFAAARYIVVEGPIRVGKSTLTRFLADRMHARRIADCEDNPFLSDFYREKAGAAFRAQMYFLMERHRRLREGMAAVPAVSASAAASGSASGAPGEAIRKDTGAAETGTSTAEHAGGSLTFPGHAHAMENAVVADFLFEKDKIFAYLNLDNEELKLYERYFERFAADLRQPDLVIYLQATPEVLQERISKKAAAGESRISREYIEGVVRAYEHFFFRYAKSNLLVVNTSEIDFVNRNADLQQLLRRIEEPVKGTQYFLPLGEGH